MVSQEELIKILNNEKDYEDRIAADLFYYIETSLDGISDMSSEEKKRALSVFSAIGKESMKHSQMFTKLIEMCLEDGEIN